METDRAVAYSSSGSEGVAFEEDRPRWSSRPAFLIASIGAAIGFGNIWRFPTLSYEFGGGAWFIPYFLALFLIGIPILVLEVAVGQFYQTGDVGSFGSINKHFRGIGLASVLCSFVINCYYTNLIAWCVVMFFRSASGSAGWRDVGEEAAIKWFEDVITGAATVTASRGPTRIVPVNLAALAFVWVFIFCSLAFGVKWTGRIAYVTVGLPVAMLLVLLVRSATLEGASDGVSAFIGKWDMKVLTERPESWSEAVTQVFFSLGVTSGIMTAFGSYNERNSPVFSNSVIIAISNSSYSFMAGFAVFSTVGYIAFREGKEIAELKGLGGPGLVFGVFPVALSTLNGAGHWERLLFVVLFMLGIDSAFALCEAVTTVFKDTTFFYKTKRVYVTASVCTIGFLCSLLFATDAGYYLLDVADFYINFMFLLVGIFECFALGWMYDWENQAARLGFAPLASLLVTAFLPLTVASGLWFGLDSKPEAWTRGNWRLLWGFVAFILCTLAGMVATFLLAIKEMANGVAREMSAGEYWIELLMGNMLLFRRRLVGVVKSIPFPWFVMVRWFLPQILLVLFANLCASREKLPGNPNLPGKPKFGSYGNYAPGYQAFGIFLFSTAALAILVGLIMPGIYSCFIPVHIEDPHDLDEKEAALAAANAPEEAQVLPGEEESAVSVLLTQQTLT